jgi:hypothetical protein
MIQERMTKKIVLEENPLLVQALLKFSYLSTYEIPSPDDPDSEDSLSPFQFHAEMYQLADKYDITDLASLAKKNYNALLTQSWDASSFLDSLVCVYTTTPDSDRGLRDVAAYHAKLHGRELEESPTLWNKLIGLREVIPSFTLDVLRLFFKSPLSGWCSACRSNQDVEAIQLRCKKCHKGGASSAPRNDSQINW